MLNKFTDYLDLLKIPYLTWLTKSKGIIIILFPRKYLCVSTKKVKFMVPVVVVKTMDKFVRLIEG